MGCRFFMAAEIDSLVTGKITGIMDYGAFVDNGGGQTGMIHISEVAPTYVTNIRDHLSVGQEVTVKVVGINEQGKISLSIKKAQAAMPAMVPASGQANAASVQNAAQADSASASPQSRPQQQPRRNNGTANTWQGPRGGKGNPSTFEDMMSQFKQHSEDKISTLRKSGDGRYSGGSNRRSGK
jgi:S1 RNA binding domain protein